MTWTDDPDERARLARLLSAVKAAERWHTGVARYLADVEGPLLVRTLQRRGMSRAEIGGVLADVAGKPLTVGRVDQIAALARRIEDGSSLAVPPPWWTGNLADAPGPDYHPLAEIVRLIPPPLPF